MAKYLLLKHYRGAPAPQHDVPMEQWTAEEISAHIQYMRDFAKRLEESGEFVDERALLPEGTWVQYGGEGQPPVTDGPFAETKDLIAGWIVIDVDSYDRAVELAAELSAAPGKDGKPIHEWLELRPPLRRVAPHRRVTVDEVQLRSVTPSVLAVLVRRGADFAAAEDAVQDALVEAVRTWPDDPPRDVKGWLVTVAWRRFLDATRSEAARRRREEHVDGGAGARAGVRRRRHAPALLPLRAPVADAVVGRGAHAARPRRAHHPPDRAGLPGARGDDGAAHQPRQAHGLRGAARPARRRRHRAARALPRVQRGLLRRRRPRRRGHPAHSPARRSDRPSRGGGAARPHAAAPRPPRRPHRARRQPRAARRAGPRSLGHRRDRRGRRDPADGARPRPARRVPGPGRDRRPPRRRADRRRDRLGADRGVVRRARPAHRQPGGAAQPCGRRRRGRRAARRAEGARRASTTRSRATPRWRPTSTSATAT